MIYSCCAEWSQRNLVRSARFDGIVFRGTYLSQCTATDLQEIRNWLTDNNIQAVSTNAFCPPEIKLVGSGTDMEQLRRYTALLAEHAASLGIRYLGVGSPNSRRLPADYDLIRAQAQWEESVSVMSEAAAPYDMNIIIEPLCTRECEWLLYLKDALKTVQNLSLSNVGILFDLYHACVMGDDPNTLQHALPYIKVVHIAQNFLGSKYYLRPDLLPVFTPYITQLRSGGYQGEFAVEATYGDIEKEFPLTRTLMETLLPNISKNS